ncbi:MAG: DUF2505 family protein [Bdellovibrionota bacterium]
MRLRFKHVFDIPRDEFEYAFACEDMERELGKLHEIERREVIAWTDDGKSFRRVSKYYAPSRIPRVVQHLFRKDLTEVEHVLCYDRTAHRGHYDVHSIMGERFVYRCEFQIDELSPDRCARDGELLIEMKIPLVGGRAEKAIAEDFLKREDEEHAAKVRFLKDTWPRIGKKVLALWPGGSALDEEKAAQDAMLRA